MSEADRLKSAEAVRDAARSLCGGKPKRKRGEHRARKRGALWVVLEDAHRKLQAEQASALFSTSVEWVVK